MQSVLDFIDGHRDRPISLRELAAVAGVERTYLCRLVKRETGYGCSAAIWNRRLARAEELLRGSPCTISDVAAAVGCDVRTLQRAFIKHLGLTPKQYRDAVTDAREPPASLRDREHCS